MQDPGVPDPTDPVASWVAKIQSGVDVEDSSHRLYDHFQPKLVRYFQRLRFDPGTCEDLTQEVFFRVFKNIDSFEHRARFVGWLFEIAHNLYANELRRIQTAKRDGVELPLQEENDSGADDRERREDRSLVAPDRDPYEEAKLREETAALRKALDTLPRQMRRCVLLRLDQGLKYREIADRLQVSVDTVKAQLGNAKVRLRQLLGGEAEIVKRLPDDGEPGP